jgi:hypothetical protein
VGCVLVIPRYVTSWGKSLSTAVKVVADVKGG